MSTKRFEGKVAVVTGGNGGMGLGAEIAFAADSSFILGAELIVDGGMLQL